MSHATSSLEFNERKSSILILYIGFFVFGLLSTVIGVTIPNIKQEFNVSNEQAGLLFVYWSAGTLIGAYIGGKVYHVGRARFLFSSTSAASIVCLLLLYGEKDLALYKLYIFVLALSGSVFFTAGHATAAHARTDSKASTLSFMDFLVSLGNLSTPFLVNSFISSDGWVRDDWRFIFVVATALLVVVTVLVLRGNLDAPDSVKDAPASKIDYFSVITNPVFLVFMLASLFLHATEWGHSVWFVTYANEIVGFSPEVARETFSLFLIGMASSRLLTSWLTRMLQPTTLMAILVSIGVVAAVSISDYQDLYALRVLNFAFGFGLGALFPLLLGLSMDRAPAQAQLLSGIGMMGGTIGAKSASYFIGLFADYSSLGESYRFVSGAMIALLLCVLAFVYFYSKAPKAMAAAPGADDESDAALAAGAQSEREEPQDGGRHAEAQFEFHFGSPEQAPATQGDDESQRQRHLLDAELQREFEQHFGSRRRLAREEALGFLDEMWNKYPPMRELYPSPAEMVAAGAQSSETST